jgi:hypothetical protein
MGISKYLHSLNMALDISQVRLFNLSCGIKCFGHPHLHGASSPQAIPYFNSISYDSNTQLYWHVVACLFAALSPKHAISAAVPMVHHCHQQRQDEEV